MARKRLPTTESRAAVLARAAKKIARGQKKLDDAITRLMELDKKHELARIARTTKKPRGERPDA